MGNLRGAQMQKMVAGVILLLVTAAAQAQLSAEDSLFSLDGDGDQIDCDNAMRATKSVCDAFGLDSDSCLNSNLDYNNRCQDLGESARKNVIDDSTFDNLESKKKEELVTLVKKLQTYMALTNRASSKIRTELNEKLKECEKGNTNPNKLKVNTEQQKIEAEEKKIEGEKAATPKKATPSVSKEFQKELTKVEEPKEKQDKAAASDAKKTYADILAWHYKQY